MCLKSEGLKIFYKNKILWKTQKQNSLITKKKLKCFILNIKFCYFKNLKIFNKIFLLNFRIKIKKYKLKNELK